LADSGVRVDAVEQLVIGCLEFAADYSLYDDLGYVVTDHVGDEAFSVFCVEDDFYETFCMADAGGFTGCGKREFANLYFVTCVAGLFFGKTDGGYLGCAVGTAGDVVVVEGLGLMFVFLFVVG